MAEPRPPVRDTCPTHRRFYVYVTPHPAPVGGVSAFDRADALLEARRVYAATWAAYMAANPHARFAVSEVTT